jgi:RNA polymerase sigma-70 factor (ECF subfamily)
MQGESSQSRQQKEEEFLSLYTACEHRLYTYIVMLIGNPTDAFDILQDTALTLWNKYDQYDRSRPFFTWAHEFAHYRTLRYRQLHAGDAPTLEPKAIDALATRFATVDPSHHQICAEFLPQCVQALSDGDRELIRLRYFAGTAVNAIAESLSRSANAISQSLIRVRRILKKCVEDAARQRQSRREGTMP